VVEIISKNIRKTDIFGRWGGEEFIVILPSTNLDNACKLAQNLREKIASYRFEQIGYKTISLGLVQYDFQEDQITFIKKADNALYEAKKNGRNRVVCKS
jgi:diguanylate cyclase (GGDEF)-like protein